jgi:ATP-dependent protease ClpP protease subunit
VTRRRKIYNRVALADLTSPRPTRWFEIIENRAGSTSTDVHIYDEIGAWGITAREFVKEFKAIKTGTINVRINSYGGEVNDGIAIYNTIAQHAANVVVWIDGIAASAASFIAMAGDQIKIARNAEVMIHDAMCAAIGNAADMLSVAEELAKCSDKIADIYAQRTGKDASHWREQMCANKGLGTRYTGVEAVEAGLADEVVGENEDAIKARARWDASIYNRARNETPDQDQRGDPSDPGARGGSEDDPPTDPPALPISEDTEITEEIKIIQMGTVDLEPLELTIDADAFRAELDDALVLNVSADDLRVTLQSVFEADQPAPDPVVPAMKVEPITLDRLAFEQTLREVLIT